MYQISSGLNKTGNNKSYDFYPMKTEKQKMLAGELYNATDPVLS